MSEGGGLRAHRSIRRARAAVAIPPRDTVHARLADTNRRAHDRPPQMTEPARAQLQRRTSPVLHTIALRTLSQRATSRYDHRNQYPAWCDPAGATATSRRSTLLTVVTTKKITAHDKCVIELAEFVPA